MFAGLGGVRWDDASAAASLDLFTPATREWFERSFEAPTPAQEAGWPAIASGEHTLIQAPTGSGKTLAAFLYGIDRLNAAPGQGLRLLYVSPLKALNYDVERNLRGPLAGLQSELTVAVRTGDTPQKERAAMLRKPPDILITTPESLFLLLTSQGREMLGIGPHADPRRGARGRRDEARSTPGAVGGASRSPRRGARPAHRPLGDAAPARGDRALRVRRAPDPARRRRHAQGARPPRRRPGRGHARAGRGGRSRPIPLLGTGAEGVAATSIWPSIYPELLRLVEEHRSTIVFVNNRRLAERLALRLNELARERRSRAPTTARWPASSGSRSRSS